MKRTDGQAWLAEMEAHAEAKRAERAHLTPDERIELGRKAAIELYGPGPVLGSSWTTTTAATKSA